MKLSDIPQLNLALKGAKPNSTNFVQEFIFGVDKNKRERSN